MKHVDTKEMSKIQGGWGFRWTCPQCSFTSARHYVQYTADQNARAHNSGNRGHTAYSFWA